MIKSTLKYCKYYEQTNVKTTFHNIEKEHRQIVVDTFKIKVAKRTVFNQ